MNCGVCNHREVCRCFPNPEEYCSDYEPERSHGEWIVRRNKQLAHIYSVCSKCNMPYLDTDFPNFCPNCGSDNRPRILDEAVDGAGKDGNVKEGEKE